VVLDRTLQREVFVEHPNIGSRMKRGETYRFWCSAAQVLLGSVAIALLTFVCFRLQVRPGIAALLYLIVLVLMSATDAFVPSVFVSIIAVLCLDYFFIPPILSFGVGNPLDIIALVSFLGIAWLITRLMSQRKWAEEALEKANGELEAKVQQRTAELVRANDELRAEIRERQRAEVALQKSQAELAHVTRVMTLGELMASIAHEVNQPLTAVVTNAQACLRWLALDARDEARAAVERIVRDSNRASEVIQRVRALVKKSDPQMVALDINDVIREAISLEQREMLNQRVSLRTELASALPPVLGDRVQLQQVVINLVMNALEAMAPVTDRPRDMLIRSQRDDSNEVLVAVRDSGTGIDLENSKRLFNAFFTTKPTGMGMGLSISRSIIEAHGGRLWVSPNAEHGATFQFTLPSNGQSVS
jgi:C4-dicarboxylate-specific signal transduction histidine kinase